VSDGETTPGTRPKPDGPAAPTEPAKPAGPPPSGDNGASAPDDMTVGQLVFDVTDRAAVLVREEIELAKTEVTEKVTKLLQGGVVALVAGVFLLAALAMIMHGFAWLLNDLFFDNFYAGFFVEAGLFLLIAAGAGLFAYRAFKKASPPTPNMAIEEAKEIKAAFDHEEGS
jgi:hypothetical protein